MTEKEEMEKLVDLIEKEKCIIESHLFELCDWMKKKYQLEDRLAKLKEQSAIPQQPLCASGDAKLPTFKEFIKGFCKRYNCVVRVDDEGPKMYYNYFMEIVGNLTKR